MKLKTILTILIILAGIAFFLVEYHEKRFDSEVHDRIEEALIMSPDPATEELNIKGHVKILGRNLRLSEAQVKDYLKRYGQEQRAGVRYWRFGKSSVVAASAFGLDWNHHFVNSYLVGYEPFETDRLWMPLYTLAMRLQYQLDSKQYGGLRDVWQTSKQAFFNTRGDCEDHAILLADWLIEMGIDARVVIGTVKNQGHAWVVVFKEGDIFLLEATNKQKRKKWRHYPLARVVPNYFPKYMFNREFFWVNTGSSRSTNYKSRYWVKKSRFVHDSKESS